MNLRDSNWQEQQICKPLCARVTSVILDVCLSSLIMKTKSILISLVSSLFATTLLQTVQAKEVSISSIPDGTYSFGLGYSSDMSPNYSFDFRKRGSKVVGIKYISASPADPGAEGEHYWQRTCIEGNIVGNKIIGTGVVIETKDKPGKISSSNPLVDWPEAYSIKMTNGRVASSEKIKEYPGHFAVGNSYGKATLNFYAYDPEGGKGRSLSKIDRQKIPTTCKSLLKNIFSRKYSGGS